MQHLRRKGSCALRALLGYWTLRQVVSLTRERKASGIVSVVKYVRATTHSSGPTSSGDLGPSRGYSPTPRRRCGLSYRSVLTRDALAITSHVLTHGDEREVHGGIHRGFHFVGRVRPIHARVRTSIDLGPEHPPPALILVRQHDVRGPRRRHVVN